MLKKEINLRVLCPPFGSTAKGGFSFPWLQYG